MHGLRTMVVRGRAALSMSEEHQQPLVVIKSSRILHDDSGPKTFVPMS